jgi:hypothetical protein
VHWDIQESSNAAWSELVLGSQDLAPPPPALGFRLAKNAASFTPVELRHEVEACDRRNNFNSKCCVVCLQFSRIHNEYLSAFKHTPRSCLAFLRTEKRSALSVTKPQTATSKCSCKLDRYSLWTLLLWLTIGAGRASFFTCGTHSQSPLLLKSAAAILTIFNLRVLVTPQRIRECDGAMPELRKHVSPCLQEMVGGIFFVATTSLLIQISREWFTICFIVR